MLPPYLYPKPPPKPLSPTAAARRSVTRFGRQATIASATMLARLARARGETAAATYYDRIATTARHLTLSTPEG